MKSVSTFRRMIYQKAPPCRTAMSLFLNKHTFFSNKTQYLHGKTRRCMYKGAPTAASTSLTVAPAECYISQKMFDVGPIQKYSSALVLHPKPDTYFSDLNMCVNLTKKYAYSCSSDLWFFPKIIPSCLCTKFYLSHLKSGHLNMAQLDVWSPGLFSLRHLTYRAT